MKTRQLKRIDRILLALSVCCLLAGCTAVSAPTETPAPIETGAPTVEAEIPSDSVEILKPDTVTVNGETFDAHAASVTFSVNSAEEALDALTLFPDLKAATLLSPALTPDEYRTLCEKYPDIGINASIRFGTRAYETTAEAIALDDLSGFDPTLFPALRQLDLGEVPPAQAAALKADMPELTVTLLYRGQRVNAETAELDLTGKAAPTAEDLSALYAIAPQLHSLVLDDPNEAEQKELAAFDPRAKGVVLHCSLSLLDRTFPADAETIDFGDRVLSDEDAFTVEAALPLFANLKEIDLYESRLGQETMDTLFDAHPDIFFGWTFGIWNDFYIVRSDATAFTSGVKKSGLRNGYLTEDDFRNLRFCKGLLALDLGHNAIKNLAFLRNWPHLKILILADTRVTDLTVIGELTELEYLELFLTTPDSYEPLTHLHNLLDLNLCHTKKEGKKYRDDDEIRLLTQIKSLERLWISKTLTKEQAQMLRDGLPGVEFDFSSNGSTDKGWREHPRYFTMREGFRTFTYIPFE